MADTARAVHPPRRGPRSAARPRGRSPRQPLADLLFGLTRAKRPAHLADGDAHVAAQRRDSARALRPRAASRARMSAASTRVPCGSGQSAPSARRSAATSDRARPPARPDSPDPRPTDTRPARTRARRAPRPASRGISIALASTKRRPSARDEQRSGAGLAAPVDPIARPAGQPGEVAVGYDQHAAQPASRARRQALGFDVGFSGHRSNGLG